VLHRWPEVFPRYRVIDYGRGPEFEQLRAGQWRTAEDCVEVMKELVRKVLEPR
jgi:hypothetical protein